MKRGRKLTPLVLDPLPDPLIGVTVIGKPNTVFAGQRLEIHAALIGRGGRFYEVRHENGETYRLGSDFIQSCQHADSD
jgi:hypothetical protein